MRFGVQVNSAGIEMVERKRAAFCLMLLRHAKASRSRSRDRDRKLTNRGSRDSAAIGKYLARHALTPDLVVVSPTRRTRQTWKRVAAAFDAPTQVRYDERLYSTSLDTILDVLKETSADVRTLMVIGHNPSLQELAVCVIGAGKIAARNRLKEKFPTAALAVVGFSVKNWSQVRPHSGRLERFITARQAHSAPK
jgi:phosphohistidine phosphatase